MEASEFTLAAEFVTLCFLYIFICQLYVIAYLMLDKMGGDIYVVGVILSLAEGISSLVSGYAMKYMSDVNVVRCSLVMCVAFNLIYYYYMGPKYPILQYFVLFLGIFGQYAPLNTSFMIQEQRLPPKYLGSASVLIFCAGPLGMSLIPYVAI